MASREIGRVNIYEFDRGWQPVVTIGDGENPKEYDLPYFLTAGDAVNWVQKWAKDRKLIVTWPTMQIRDTP